MKPKKLQIIIILCVMLCCLSGCGQVNFTYECSDNGQYRQILDITLDEQLLEYYDCNLNEACAIILKVLKGEGYSVDIQKNHIMAVQTFDTFDEMGKTKLGNGLTKTQTSSDEDLIFRYDKTRCKTIYDFNYMLELMLYLREKYDISPKYANSMMLREIKTSYNYKSIFKSISSDADEITKDGDYYIHKWNIDNENEINLTVRSPKMAVWYAFAIILAVVTIFIITTVNVAKNKRKSKNGGFYGN